ncbi:MFS transporter [Alicyclobacillus curvatus]|nr:MFS transporter [Alicyclobacillus curvatus]
MMELEQSLRVQAVPSKTNWNVILAFAAVAVTTQLLWVTFTPITTQSAQVLGVSENAVGWLSEVFPLVYVILAIPFGLLTDRWFRQSVAIGTVLTVVGGILRIDEHFTTILIGQLITSVGQPLILNAINKVALLYATPKRQTVAISMSSASLFLGILLAMLSAPLLLAQFDLRTVIIVQAVFGVAAGAWFFIALYSPGGGRRALGTMGNMGTLGNMGNIDSGEARSGRVSLREVWSNRHVRQLSYLLFVGFGLFIALTTWLQALLAPKHISDVAVGIALALMTAAGMAGAAVVPDFAMRKQKGRIFIVASLIASLAVCLYVLIGVPFWIMTGLLMIAGFLLLSDLPIVLTTAELLSKPNEAGTVTALLMLFGNLGGIVLALFVQILMFSSIAAVGVLVLAAILAIPLATRFPAYRSKSDAS